MLLLLLLFERHSSSDLRSSSGQKKNILKCDANSKTFSLSFFTWPDTKPCIIERRQSFGSFYRTQLTAARGLAKLHNEWDYEVLDAQFDADVDQEEPDPVPDGRRAPQFRLHEGRRRVPLYECYFLISLSSIKRWYCSVTRLLHYLFNIWALTHLKNCPKAYKICQNKFKMFPNTKWTLSKWPKFLNVVPKWRNVAKSGHTGS